MKKGNVDHTLMNAIVNKQLDKAIGSAEDFIDLGMTETCKYLETLNKGELRGVRALVEQKVAELDRMGAELLDSKKDLTTVLEKTQLGSVFGLTQRTLMKLGVIDYFILKGTKK